MAHVSHKLKNSFEGALAGGGDPATSPLYVFGPFLKLIVVAGVANVTFGTSVWMVILTIAVVSAMYRLVMRWVTDGSGGSGLSEEEFGGWAVKVNAAITFVEYTLTFLVSMAAMVTFIADRIPLLNEKFLWIQYRTLIAIALSILTGWLVNRGPKMAARTFGPATAGVLILLWAMVIATIVKYGIRLPEFNFEAFNPEYLEFTIGGYVRILAVMTGIEVFANLVAAYDGTPREKSNKAFKSLLIIMGTTAITMLIVGPAILDLADYNNHEVSVFTQTMDQLLPAPLPWFGTMVGVLVLMSASAASSQGLQNLALGLAKRNYIPPNLGKQNKFEVADKPVWIEVAIVIICFLFFGTHEETYLAIYAAGVFILLSMTGWAVTKRLMRQLGGKFSIPTLLLIGGTILASLLTTAATVIIFNERFLEGAWTYFLFIPLLFGIFTYFRNSLGAPSPLMDYLGRFDASQLAGFGLGQAVSVSVSDSEEEVPQFSWQPEAIEKSRWRDQTVTLKKIVVLLDGSKYAAQAIPYAESLCVKTGAKLILLSAFKSETEEEAKKIEKKRKTYLSQIAEELSEKNITVQKIVRQGSLSEVTKRLVHEQNINLVVTSTRGASGNVHWLKGGVSSKLMRTITTPVLLVPAKEDSKFGKPNIENILVSLDGSIYSEAVLPYARALANAYSSDLVLLSVPAVPEAESYRAPGIAVETIRSQMVNRMEDFLKAVARSLSEDKIDVKSIVTGSRPSQTILKIGKEEKADLIMMTSRGRGDLEVWLTGSVAESVVEKADKAVMMVPIHK
ncbi:MAG: universal stress protein [Chloroflexi bacterium]|jgi:nucleotide-binding universal stress UspA family protein|nr:universal stress protein [Chloroflexota bacterium]MBT3670533.1 universal stress protein [Chloroflexota bacterium]MBT4304168.1 universal stress protein [Chloroflexota bacterium]MBT4533473.1 universal stress protein [Chloroflexota bacterium]MBT4683570.1 universal stress protein [Chloroflexota bacterium]